VATYRGKKIHQRQGVVQVQIELIIRTSFDNIKKKKVNHSEEPNIFHKGTV
jgi:hypothetical protein